MSQKSFFIQTFGCQMNVADTENMKAILNDEGLKEAENPDYADVILVNGCSIREKAVHKAVSALGRFQHLKAERAAGSFTGPFAGPFVGLGGCVGQLDKGAVFKQQPYVDFVFGPDTMGQLPEILHRLSLGERHIVTTEWDRAENYSTQTRLLKPQAQAFVNIMKGCDKYCSYCIVPFTRGREKSRSIDEVLDDLAGLVSQGVREVTLLGQNVNSFGKGNVNSKGREPLELHNIIGPVGPKKGEENFPQLLRAIDSDERLSQLQRLRFTSSHPLDFSDELIECYHPLTGVKKLARHLHLPVQSGSNRVLQKMGRHHRIENYILQMERLKEMAPDVGLSTDLILGFPTETLEDFEETLKLIETLRYDSLYAFAYSPRPGTRAEKLKDEVPTEEKSRRLNTVLARAREIGLEQHQKRIGKTLPVLVESPAKNENLTRGHGNLKENLKVWTGRSSCNCVVNFASPGVHDFTGTLIPLKITHATALALQGEVLV